MTAFLVAWALVATVGSFVVLALVVGLEIRDRLHAVRPEPQPAPASRIPEQRSAAVIVEVVDVDAFDTFLRELIVTPHVETALS